MRSISPRRRQRLAEAQPACNEFRSSVDLCEWCKQPERVVGVFQMHEISRGGDRMKSRGVRALSLMLCLLCHQEIPRLPRAAQLALVYLNRPGDYSLEIFHAVTDRCYPNQSEVDLWIRRLLRNER